MSEKKNGNGNGNGKAVELPVKIEVKAIKHAFTLDERDQLGADLAQAIGALRQIEFELDQLKSSYKAKTNEAEARINKLSTDRTAGWEFRNERCRVRYFPQDRRKKYFLESDVKEENCLLDEEMAGDDFQQELIQADQKFDHLEKIALFPPAGSFDQGVLIVGQLGKLWYSAIRVTVGKQVLNERMDSEQPGAKERWGAINQAADRYEDWLMHALGKDSSAGFRNPMISALEPHRERVE